MKNFIVRTYISRDICPHYILRFSAKAPLIGRHPHLTGQKLSLVSEVEAFTLIFVWEGRLERGFGSTTTSKPFGRVSTFPVLKNNSDFDNYSANYYKTDWNSPEEIFIFLKKLKITSYTSYRCQVQMFIKYCVFFPRILGNLPPSDVGEGGVAVNCEKTQFWFYTFLTGVKWRLLKLACSWRQETDTLVPGVKKLKLHLTSFVNVKFLFLKYKI